MSTRKQILFPRPQKILEQVGEPIKLARKRRKLTTIQVAERAGIDRTTLYHIERASIVRECPNHPQASKFVFCHHTILEVDPINS